jgi:hypothetical protein
MNAMINVAKQLGRDVVVSQDAALINKQLQQNLKNYKAKDQPEKQVLGDGQEGNDDRHLVRIASAGCAGSGASCEFAAYKADYWNQINQYFSNLFPTKAEEKKEVKQFGTVIWSDSYTLSKPMREMSPIELTELLRTGAVHPDDVSKVMDYLSSSIIGPDKGGVAIGTEAAKNAGNAIRVANSAEEAAALAKSAGKGAANSLKLKSGYDTHLTQVEDIVRKKNRGVVGGHNLENFEKAFTDRGWSLEENIISKTPHPSMNGVYEVKYQIPAVDTQGNIIAGQYKNIPNPKTVYDPKIISDEQMLDWGREAMKNGTVNRREITGYSSNGLKFQGYIENGEITNFFPTLK